MAKARSGTSTPCMTPATVVCCLLLAACGSAQPTQYHSPGSKHTRDSHARAGKQLRAAPHLQPPAPAGRTKAAVGKLLAESIRVLKGSVPRPPPPSRGPPLDCSKHPGLCQPESCEVWRTDIKDKCRYVRDKDACGADDQYIPYLQLFYCASGNLWLLVSAFLVIWLLLLFYAMSVVAEVFLCPAVQYISERLQLPPDIAGVTLLAFASGAPDIFTQIAAINGGHAVELELAVSSVMGSGLFICCVSLAGVLFVKGIGITDRMAFVRDVAAYLIASAVTLALLWDGAFARYEAIVLILLYVLYLCICIYTSRGGAPVAAVHQHTALPTSSPRIGRRSSDSQEVQLADASAFVTLNNSSSSVHSAGKGPSAAGQRSFGGSRKAHGGGQLANGHARGTGQLPKGNVRMAVAAQWAPASPKAARFPGAAGAPAPLQRSAAACRLAEPPHHSTTSSSAHFGSSVGVTPDSPLPVSTDLKFPVAAAAVAAVPWSAETGLQHPTGADGPTNSLLACGCGSSASGAVQRLLSAAKAVCAEHLHLHGSWPWDGVVLATAPLVLLMHATMPAVSRGHSSHRYCVTLAVAAPAFSLLIAGGLRLGIAACAAIWGAAAAALYAAMHFAYQRGEAAGRSIPKANAVFAALAFVLSAAWLGTIADEVVALLNGAGAILGIEEDVLGATVLALGETLPDLVAMLAVARAGQGTMAVAACFGGPVLNLLMGTGVPVLGASFKHGILPFKLTHGVVALFLETVALCAALLLVVPTVCNWVLPRRIAWLLLGSYLVFQFLFLAADQHWLF